MNPARSHGFTLLEVLLALTLTSLILVALGMAIDFHFRVLDTGRAHVEEAQLARVLLRRIADDLRGAVVGTSQNAQPSGMPSTSSGDASAPESASESNASKATPSESKSSASTDRKTASGGSTGETQSTTPHAAPGVYGNSNTLQVDVSRLPQPYQLLAVYSAAAENLSPASLSDVKTVTYFVNSVQGAGVADMPSSVSGEQGLMRCEQDRAVASYQAEQGGVGATDMKATLLAPEVVGIEFRYCDGTQWLDSWDTSQNGGLPLAVRATVYITPSKSKRSGSLGLGGRSRSGSLPENALAYSLVVSIPTVPPEQTSDASETTEN